MSKILLDNNLLNLNYSYYLRVRPNIRIHFSMGIIIIFRPLINEQQLVINCLSSVQLVFFRFW
jgi:hypothetical protein